MISGLFGNFMEKYQLEKRDYCRFEKACEEFDFDNNTREYLLTYFSIREGKTALEKAEVNKQLYDALKEYGE